MDKEYTGFKDIIGKRNTWFAASIIVIAIGIISIAMPQRRLNVGVDFTGGYLITYPTDRKVTTEEVEKIVKQVGIKHNPVQVTYGGREFLLRTAGYKVTHNKEADTKAREKFEETMKDLKIRFRLGLTNLKAPVVEMNFMPNVPKEAEINDLLKKKDLGGVSVASITSEKEAQGEGERASYNVKVSLSGAGDRAVFEKAATEIYKEKGGYERIAEQGETAVDPIFSTELFKRAAIALAVAVGLILFYIALRFEFWFAVAGIIAIFHDCLITLGMYSLLQLEVDVSFVAVILTVFGYSINDTIIIFDRIRENLRKDKRTPLHQLINYSLWETMTRSINTVLTVEMTLLAVILFGGESVRSFSVGLFISIGIGTFSSIFVAAPVAFVFKSATGMKDRAISGGAPMPQAQIARKKDKLSAPLAAQPASKQKAEKTPAASAKSGETMAAAPGGGGEAKKPSQSQQSKKKGKQRRR